MSNRVYLNMDGSIGQEITDLGNTFVSAEISGGAITYSATLMSVEPENLAAVDELHTIANGGTGKLLLLRTQSTGRRVLLKHGSGNIWSTAGDILLDDPNRLIMLIYNGQNWVVMGNDGAGGTLMLTQDSCVTYYNDFDSPPIGDASWSFPTAERPFGVIVGTAGGIGQSTGGRTSPGVAKSTPVSNGTVQECTVIIDYGSEAACEINQVRFWYRVNTYEHWKQAFVLVRFFSGAGALIGSHMIDEGTIKQSWTQAQWIGSMTGVRYVAMTHYAGTAGTTTTYIDEVEVN